MGGRIGGVCRTDDHISQDLTLPGSLNAVHSNCNSLIGKELWSELEASRNSWERPWVVCGDFNVTRFVVERGNCLGATSEFSEIIYDLELVDPLLFGGSYTWRRGENHSSASRVDRFLYSVDWRIPFYWSSSLCYLI